MLRIFVNGSNGKMGQEVIKLVSKSSDFYLFGGLDRNKKENCNYRIFSSILELSNFISLDNKPDVIIDFSVPEASFKILDFANQFKIPIVIAVSYTHLDVYKRQEDTFLKSKKSLLITRILLLLG